MTTFTDQKSSQDIATDPRQKQTKHDGLTTLEQTENKRIPVPEHIEQEPEKRAFGAVFLDPMINHDCLTDMNKVVEH
jgi:hypothetical protein